MYKVIFVEKAEKQLEKLDNLTQERIIKAFERIKIRPEAFVEKLVGESGYKLRVGDYRLILDIDKSQLIILVLKLGHRKNIYKE
jgi:mRNA interferase RelE/StbE